LLDAGCSRRTGSGSDIALSAGGQRSGMITAGLSEITKPKGTTAIFAATDGIEHVAALRAHARGLGAP